MNKFFKIIRTITVAPIMTFVMLSILYYFNSSLFGRLQLYLMSVLFLTILPLLAYPLQPFVPKYKNGGREGQRNLAITMAVLGFVLSIISAMIFRVAKPMWVIYLVYCISGILILFFNKILKIRASGHAAGVTAPTIILIYLSGMKGIYAVLVIILVYWSSIKMRRHTPIELILGSIISIIALALAVI